MDVGKSLEALRQRQQELHQDYKCLLREVKGIDDRQENESLLIELTEAKDRSL